MEEERGPGGGAALAHAPVHGPAQGRGQGGPQGGRGGGRGQGGGLRPREALGGQELPHNTLR